MTPLTVINQSLDELIQAFNHDPGNPFTRQKLGRRYVQEENYTKASENYGLERIDRREIEVNPDDVLCFMTVKNELLRLPYWFSFYRGKGLKKFFIIDNASTDGTVEFLARQTDVYLWSTSHSFRRAQGGIDWKNLLRHQYGQGHWCMLLDADELLYYPRMESLSIPDLCRILDHNSKAALTVVLLDMYSDKPIGETFYQSGDDFLQVCPYFDRQFYHHHEINAGPFKNSDLLHGGMRERVFDQPAEMWEFLVNKVPLLKSSCFIEVTAGHHWASVPKEQIAEVRGALLHFKYFHIFQEKVKENIRNTQHFAGSTDYKKYNQKLIEVKDLNLFDYHQSIKLESSQALLAAEVMMAGELASSPKGEISS